MLNYLSYVSLYNAELHCYTWSWGTESVLFLEKSPSDKSRKKVSLQEYLNHIAFYKFIHKEVTFNIGDRYNRCDEESWETPHTFPISESKFFFLLNSIIKNSPNET